MNQAGPTESLSDPASDRTLPPNRTAAGSVAGARGDGAASAAASASPGGGGSDTFTGACPHCKKPVRIDRRKLKPGKFRLRCGSCRNPFGMLVDERMEVRIGKLAERTSTSGDQDELPPDIAATLGMNKPASVPRPLSRRPGRSLADSGAGMSAGDSYAGMSGSYTAIPSETLTGVTASGSMAGVTADPDSGGRGSRGFITPPSYVGPSLPPPEVSPGDRLSGYELKKKLGEGGMGAVYLARQMSLDRSVALKVLSPRLSNHPALVSRFMREAYAAGQLVHHNVVQIYDFGKDKPRRGSDRSDQQEQDVFGGAVASSGAGSREIHFFSMEFVDGRSLQDMVKDRGALEPHEAVSLVLQAARGLAFAHEHGIIHRDIKPDNLMLNRQGILKVADLGLVKQIGMADLRAVPADLSGGDGNDMTAPPPDSGSLSAAASAQITQVSQMMGTPAYMPPEQATDAKSADARADIYSLGCTLYHLLVGRPPFGGKTLHDVLEAHRTQKVRFPDPMDGGPKISSHLKEIIRRMCSKQPKDRFSSMQRVIRELEAYLEEKHQATADPDEQQKKTLEWAAQQFGASGWARMRPLVIVAFIVLVLVGVVTAGSLFKALVAFGAIGGLLGMVVLTFLFSFVLGGRRRRDVLYTKSRELVFGAGVVDWLIALLAVGLLIFWLYSFGWLPWWGGAAVLAFVLAWTWQAIVDRGVQADQAPMVVRAERILRELREAGFEEARIRRAVGESGGRHWEGFYEALFGYEAKLDARETYGVDEKGREKPRYAPWRDPILSWLNDRLEKRRLKRDQKFLKGLHKNELLAQGLKNDIADKAALNQARREIGEAAMMREQMMAELRRELRREMLHEQRAKEEDAEGEEEGKKFRRGAKIKYSDEDFERIHESYFKRRFGTPMDLLLGQQVRFAIAALLLVCFALWFSQNQQEIFLGDAASEVSGDEDAARAEEERRIALAATGDQASRKAVVPWWQRIWSAGKPLDALGLDPSTTAPLSGFHVGLAGVLMMLGAFFYGRVLGIATLVSIILIVPVTYYAMPDTSKWITILGGTVLWAVSIFFLRSDTD